MNKKKNRLLPVLLVHEEKGGLGPSSQFLCINTAHAGSLGDVNFKFKCNSRILYINSTETPRPQKSLQCYRLLPLGLFIVHIQIAI